MTVRTALRQVTTFSWVDDSVRLFVSEGVSNNKHSFFLFFRIRMHRIANFLVFNAEKRNKSRLLNLERKTEITDKNIGNNNNNKLWLGFLLSDS